MYRTVGVISSLSALDNEIQMVIYVTKADRTHVAYLYWPDIGIIRIGLKCVISLPMLSTLLEGPEVASSFVVIVDWTRFLSGSGKLLDISTWFFSDSSARLIERRLDIWIIIMIFEIVGYTKITCYHFQRTWSQYCSLRIAMVLYYWNSCGSVQCLHSWKLNFVVRLLSAIKQEYFLQILTIILYIMEQ